MDKDFPILNSEAGERYLSAGDFKKLVSMCEEQHERIDGLETILKRVVVEVFSPPIGGKRKMLLDEIRKILDDK